MWTGNQGVTSSSSETNESESLFMVFTLGSCTQTLLFTGIRHVSATHLVQNAETPGVGCNERTSSDDGRSTETCLTSRMRASR